MSHIFSFILFNQILFPRKKIQNKNVLTKSSKKKKIQSKGLIYYRTFWFSTDV